MVVRTRWDDEMVGRIRRDDLRLQYDKATIWFPNMWSQWVDASNETFCPRFTFIQAVMTVVSFWEAHIKKEAVPSVLKVFNVKVVRREWPDVIFELPFARNEITQVLKRKQKILFTLCSPYLGKISNQSVKIRLHWNFKKTLKTRLLEAMPRRCLLAANLSALIRFDAEFFLREQLLDYFRRKSNQRLFSAFFEVSRQDKSRQDKTRQV